MRDLFLIIIAYRAIFSVSANSHDGRCYSDPNGNQQQCSKQKTEEGSVVLIVGGYTLSNAYASFTTSVEAIRFPKKSENRCSFLPDLPEPTDGAMAFFHETNYLTFCGGYGDTEAFSGKCRKFDGKIWRDLGEKIAPRRFSTSITTNYQLTYILGGETRSYVYKTLEVLTGPDLKSSARSPLEFGISRHCFVQIDSDHLLAIGGRLMTDEKVEFSNRVFSYSIKQDHWSDFPNLLQGRQFHSCTTATFDSAAPRVVVVGGRNQDILNTVEIFNSEKNIWESGPSLAIPVFMSALIADKLGGAILVGGHSNESFLDTIYLLKRENGTLQWSNDKRTLSEPRRSHSAILVPQRFCQDNWKLLVVGAKPHGGSLGNSFVLDLSMEGKQCENLPDYPILPVQLAASFDDDGSPIFCGNSTHCYRFENGQFEKGPELNEFRFGSIFIRIFTSSSSFLWIAGSYGTISSEILRESASAWEKSIDLPGTWGSSICGVKINEDKIFISPSDKSESKFLIVSQMSFVDGPAPLNFKDGSDVLCATINTRANSRDRSVIRMLSQEPVVEFLDIIHGDVNAETIWRSSTLDLKVCHSQMVETPDGGVVIVAGYQNIAYLNTLYKLDHSKSTQWTKLTPSLQYATTHHVALMIPDQFAECS